MARSSLTGDVGVASGVLSGVLHAGQATTDDGVAVNGERQTEQAKSVDIEAIPGGVGEGM
jgi:hypothetical protein